MELDVNILRDMLTERGFYPGNRGNEHVWKNVINGIPYAVDFRIGSVFRYMYGQREEHIADLYFFQTWLPWLYSSYDA